MRRVHVLGSTGSIGRTAEQVLEELVGTHQVAGLSVGKDVVRLLAQAERWHPRAVAVADARAAEEVRARLESLGIRVFVGPDAAAAMVTTVPADVVLNGISGAVGLAASFAAIRRGSTLALANKESMVMAGPLLVREAARSGATLLPVDSEHNAIFQCLGDECLDGVRRLLLTASGGPFRSTPAKELEHVTPEQALRHPTWNMGGKITIDSATLMNKALEVIEARWLFGIPADRIAVLVHPQSIVHSIVEFEDGCMLAQLGVPDMAVPIRFALAFPKRATTRRSYFDLERFKTLTFEAPDHERFPALALGFEAARRGGNAGAVLNAANEVAVAAFLAGTLPFNRISSVVAATLERVPHVADPDLDQVLAADRAARTEAAACCS
jgi:1-deoxy-D-xylulose-5-phosphate reductoisomerase